MPRAVMALWVHMVACHGSVDVHGVLYWYCWATLKKCLFPVQRVAILVASREAAKSFFFKIFVFSV